MKYIKIISVFILANIFWIMFAVFVGLYGWWMSPIVQPDDHQAFNTWAIAEIERRNKGNTAYILIEDTNVAHEHFGRDENEVNRDTLFPTASFSKWITAMAVMVLVQEDKLDLDAAVNTYVTRWQLPDSPFDHSQVTTRKLLSHTAGLTDGLGFGEYSSDETLPSLEEELAGPRASRDGDVRIEVGTTPGSKFMYSGGGYLLLQLLVEEISGQGFSEFVDERIFQPMNMTTSSYDFPGELENVTENYKQDGSTVPHVQYASAAATGLSSSASDLLSMVQFVLSETGGSLSPETFVRMREPHAHVFGAPIWGLGTILYSENGAGDFVFGHDGGNEPAINVSVRINPATRDAIIILVNGHPTLASNISSEWVLWQTGYPDFLSTNRAIRSSVVPVLLGGIVILCLCILWYRREKLSTKK